MHELKTIHRVFEEQVATRPDAIAIDGKNRLLTYQTLNDSANQLAHILIEAGVQPNMPIAFCMPRSPELLITILAILKAGGAYLPLDASQPIERLLRLLKDSGSPLLILPHDLKSTLATFQGKLVVFPPDLSVEPSSSAASVDLRLSTFAEPPQNAIHDLSMPAAPSSISRAATPTITEHDLNSRDLAYIIYTSGSTGNPKGVLIEHQSVIHYAQWFSAYAGLESLSRIDCSSQIIFDIAVTTSIVPLMLGKTLVLCEDEIKSNSKHYLEYLSSECIELIKITPSYFQLLLHEVQNASSPPPLPDLKRIILGGENLPTALCKSWLERYPHHLLYNEYGPTEATVAVSSQKVSTENLHLFDLYIPIGKPCPHASFHLLKEAESSHKDTEDNNLTYLEDAPFDQILELAISGPCLARGYLGQPETTRTHFIAAPFDPSRRLYKTGDLCRQLSDGNWLYLGRKDNQVKVRGYRVEPAEVETIIKRHPAIKDVVVVTKKDALQEKRLVAYYILGQAEFVLSSHDIRLYLQSHLADYMIPSQFIAMDIFPLTSNGKLDTHALPEPQLIGHGDHSDHSIVYSPLEQRILKIWSEELGVNRLGIQDNFFELGGHSLSAARIVSRISQELSKDISLRDFYTAATVGSFADLIVKTEPVANLSEMTEDDTPPTPQNNRFALSDFQLMLWLALTFEPKARNLNIVARKCIQGQLDETALRFAFDAVLKHHEILTYQILKFRPAQKLQKKYQFELKKLDLSALRLSDCEPILEASMQSMSTFKHWQRGTPLLLAKLYQLSSDKYELQICMPHIIADDVSPEILFSSLAKFYNAYLKEPSAAQLPQLLLETFNTEYYMKQQIAKEITHWKHHLDKDIQFWQDYLRPVALFAFPEKFVIRNMIKRGLPYSTYVVMPQALLKKFQGFCSKNQVSLNNGLCAVLAKVLHEHGADRRPQSILMNLVKSTRDHPNVDHALGCFLRLEPIKVTVDQSSTLPDLMHQVHQSMMETYPYQRCPGLVKLASISTFRRRNKWIYRFIHRFLHAYTALFRISDPLRKIIKLSARLSSRGLKNRFLISLNMHSNFLANASRNSTDHMGNLTFEAVKTFQEDLLQVNNYFDVCLLFDEAKSTSYLVISSNLDAQFRQTIAEKMIAAMDPDKKDKKDEQEKDHLEKRSDYL